jgi:hypothetical protein
LSGHLKECVDMEGTGRETVLRATFFMVWVHWKPLNASTLGRSGQLGAQGCLKIGMFAFRLLVSHKWS